LKRILKSNATFRFLSESDLEDSVAQLIID
jgi:hypothetical protein